VTRVGGGRLLLLGGSDFRGGWEGLDGVLGLTNNVRKLGRTGLRG